MELAIILWVIFSAIVGQHAHHYGRSGLAWFLASLLFSPLLVGIVALFAGRKEADTRTQRWMLNPEGVPIIVPDTIPCPRCAEQIKPQAKVCRFCQAELTPLLDGPGCTVGELRGQQLARKVRRAEALLH